MRERQSLSYRDAVAILGGDSPALAAADQALGGALNLATGGVSDTVLDVFQARGRILRLGRDLTSGLRGRLGGAERATRTERLAAAHAVLVITAYFEAFGEAELPFDPDELRLTRREQVSLAGGEPDVGNFVRALTSADIPLPVPHQPREELLAELIGWYERLSTDLVLFVRGLAVWDALSETDRSRTQEALRDRLPPAARERYGELYAQLATELPEFAFWTGETEHQATRATIRQALTGIETALADLTAVRPFTGTAAALATGYRATLSRPILAEGEDAPEGIRLPTLEEGYIDPDFRVRADSGNGAYAPAEEEWWASTPVRSDLTEYLAGAVTSLASTTAPLVVLGQPGAGKSVLTKILAARLSAAGFLPVRVVLREIPADAEIQDQIEHAIRATTGERTSWPELIRSAPGAVPVLLFDGFDELLQVTGASQSDYLLRVARFQQREADQGRQVLALVTSRTAVADRARYVPGTVVVRLEPFRDAQVERWLALWNRMNESHFAARGLCSLPATVAARHRELSSQPLLLLMLALYDADENALQRGTRLDPIGDGQETHLDETDLYESLLASFATREVAKTEPALMGHQLTDRVEQELQRLSLISFGMLNRRRQWITTDELGQDLTALLGRQDTRRADFQAPLGRAEIALGRFFFIQRAQAVQEERKFATYEFLHATFGEYLTARLAVLLLSGLLSRRPALSLAGAADTDDDLLYALLSYAPLSSRQMLRFVRARMDRLTREDREQLGELLISVMGAHRTRVEHRFADYRPTVRATSSRHGVYGANLMMLTVMLRDGVTASEVFPDHQDPVNRWHRYALLWRSAFSEAEWTEFALALTIRRTWVNGRRELVIRPSYGNRDFLDTQDPVDAFMLYGRPPREAGDDVSLDTWSRPYAAEIRHKMAVSGGTNDSAVLHAVEPFFARLPSAVTAYAGTPGGTAESAAHAVTSLWLASRLGAPVDELAGLYERCVPFMGHRTPLGTQGLEAVSRLVLEQLVADAARLPSDVVFHVLVTATSAYIIGPHVIELVLRVATVAVGVMPDASDEVHAAIARLGEMHAELSRYTDGPTGPQPSEFPVHMLTECGSGNIRAVWSEHSDAPEGLQEQFEIALIRLVGSLWETTSSPDA
ncbi:hypothetical protein [Streptomyces sp. NPDC003077]|uniref:NACHT domain-containing protein n=1 Tax=Streptomyces sp. NPDC003077 TaxID=3154443 RepID=UPI0033A8DCBE